MKKSSGKKWFKFGGGERLQSKGVYTIPAVIAGKEVFIETDVVDSDIPLLLSMEAMKKAKVKLDLENDMAEIYGVSIALNHTSSGHYAVSIDRTRRVSSVCAVQLDKVSNQERYKALLKLHRQFTHPTQKKLITLLKDAGAWNEVCREDLDDIYRKCELCRVYKRTPDRPAVALPMANSFNDVVSMDLKKWGDKWILHLIDMFSRFSVSVFISRKRPCDVIDKIMTCWVGAGFGVMGSILTDNGGEFSSDEMREVASILNVQTLTTAAESPFQNGLCERNHAVIDMMLVKLQEQCPKTDLNVLLAWANVAKNSLQMWHGFSSYQIVFGKNPNLPNVMTDQIPARAGSTTSEVLAKHLIALHEARQAYVRSEADERIRRALRSKIRSSEQIYEYGQRVYYKREGQERWLGPGTVIFQDGKVVFVRHGGVYVRVSPNRLLKAGEEFNTDARVSNPLRGEEFESGNTSKVNDEIFEKSRENVSTHEPTASEMIGTDTDTETVAASAGELVDKPFEQGEQPSEHIRIAPKPIAEENGDTPGEMTIPNLPKKHDKVEYKMLPDDKWVSATILSRAGKASGKYANWFNVKNDESGLEMCIDFQNVAAWRNKEYEVCLVLVPRSRHGEECCIKAKQAELEKLKTFDTYQEVEDTGQFKISTTWVLYWKGDEVRARLVARGYEEVGEFRKDSPTICKSSLRVLLCIAASKGWQVKTTDIKSAFLQGRKLERKVFLKPPKEAQVNEGTIWELNHCLYGLNDASREFYFSVVEAMKEVGCQQSRLDPALFYFSKNGCLMGIMASHVDDFLHAGESEFGEHIMRKLRDRFLAGKIEVGNFGYVGFQVTQSDEGIELNQDDYVQGLDDVVVHRQQVCNKQEAVTSAEQTLLRGLVGCVNWAVQGTRPDVAFDVVDLSTRFQCASVGDLIRAVKVIVKLKSETVKVSFPNLGDCSTWSIVVFTDASHANICNGQGSVGAHAVFVRNSHWKTCPLHWQAGKIKRVVKSSLAAEALSLQEGVDAALYTRHVLCEIMGVSPKTLPLIAYVDNKGLVEAVHSTRLVDDKRLRITIGAMKELLDSGEVSSVIWIPGNVQIVNCMTKKGASGYQLRSVVESGRITPTDQ